MSDITVIVPTSPIQSHPSANVILSTVASIRESLPLARIIITCDGAEADNLAYFRYVDWIKSHWGEHGIIAFPSHVHQSGMLEMALGQVETPLVYYLEHDWLTLPGVPWPELSALIISGEFSYIKLHAAPRINPHHEHLMEKRLVYQYRGYTPAGKHILEGAECYSDHWGGLATPMIRTRQWSQNPHLASTEFYRKIEREHLRGKYDFIENVLHGIVANSPWEDWKLGIFNPPSGDMFRIHHLDGKNSQ